MPKLFDRFEKAVFTAVNKIYAELTAAVWVSVDETITFTGKVLFNNPTHNETLVQVEFTEIQPYFEYLAPAFPGLKIRVDSNSPEVITISGTAYIVTHVHRLSDGNNYKAMLSLIDSEYGPETI